MKILWIKTDFLHPTNRGGQIRTLEMIRRLHKRHEVHYVALDDGAFPEGPQRASEYSTKHYAVHHVVPPKTSWSFRAQLLTGLLDPLPVAGFRYRSAGMAKLIDELTSAHNFDSVVCDFLFPASNIRDLSRCVLFQHNVEAMIWRRHVEHAATAAHRWYLNGQYRRMFDWERDVCQKVRRVIAVSEPDAEMFRADYGVRDVTSVPTGVDIDYFRPPAAPAAPTADLIFLGSMDWHPNVDGAKWFAAEVLPLIRARRPQTTVAMVGRNPTAEVSALGSQDPGIRITGTVADVRPWLHGGTISIVPLRIGGGTRLKIYEAMAAAVPVVSTTVGAEGLDVRDGENIILADAPQQFAECCLALLEDKARRDRLSAAALSMVSTKYSWDAITDDFEQMIAP